MILHMAPCGAFMLPGMWYPALIR